jgi:diaminohydroxyphosphoribosylaminopyrimidine deaminase/5-amino-6-(5-phosphoribosylamino)uracil reductase
VDAGIKKVVAPMEDPNPLVSGRGFAHLREAGILVDVGLMAKEAMTLNEKYVHFMREKRPFVHLKLAVSLDGRIATRTGDSHWITGEESRARVHQLRHEYDAILVGSGTALHDDPRLTDRSGNDRHRPLLRIVLDSQLSLPTASKLCQTAHQAPLLVFARQGADGGREAELKANGVEVVYDKEGPRNLRQVLRTLADRSIQSVLVEGGATIAGAFLDAHLIDKVSFFVAPTIIGGLDAFSAIGGNGAQRMADAVNLKDVAVTRRGRDIEVTGYTGASLKEDG